MVQVLGENGESENTLWCGASAISQTKLLPPPLKSTVTFNVL